MKSSTQPAFFAWSPAAWLRVSGPDAAGFLQGQFTNDLRGLAAGEARYGLWLNAKGRVIADSFVLRGGGPDEFWVGSYDSPAAVVRERLEGFVIADDLVVEDRTKDWAAVSILGSGAKSAVAGAGRGEATFAGRRERAENFEWVFPVAARAEVQLRLEGRAELSAGEIARRRIAAGIPAVPADLGPGDLPNEAGVETEAISYTKGCYLGQEVMARLKSMGQVRRRLLRVAGIGEIPALPAALFCGEREIGALRSAAPDAGGGWIGLAMLTLASVAAGSTLAFTAGGSAAVRVTELP
jgi:folate-binding protein YgfZ